MELFDFVLAFADVIATSFNDRTHALQVNVAGIGSYDPEDDLNNLEAGEVGDDGEAFGALGVIARPLDPETINGKDFNAEVICARTDDGLTPIAWRDLRLFQFFPNGMPKGRVSLVGYGGGFHSLDVVDSGDRQANIHVIYCPFEYVGDTPQRASSIIMDPNPANGITVTHGISATEGYQAVLNDDGIQFRGPSGQTFVWMTDDDIILNAKNSIRLKGNVLVGSADAGHLPLLAGTASPACPTLWLSPV